VASAGTNSVSSHLGGCHEGPRHTREDTRVIRLVRADAYLAQIWPGMGRARRVGPVVSPRWKEHKRRAGSIGLDRIRVD
jgi:hypothetical protein